MNYSFVATMHTMSAQLHSQTINSPTSKLTFWRREWPGNQLHEPIWHTDTHTDTHTYTHTHTHTHKHTHTHTHTQNHKQKNKQEQIKKQEQTPDKVQNQKVRTKSYTT